MKKLLLIVILLFWAGTLFGQQKQQVKQLQDEIVRLNIVLGDVKADRDNLTLAVAKMNDNAIALNNGIEKTRAILQDAIDNNGGKIDVKKLNEMQWGLIDKPDPDKSGKKPSKDKNRKDNK